MLATLHLMMILSTWSNLRTRWERIASSFRVREALTGTSIPSQISGLLCIPRESDCRPPSFVSQRLQPTLRFIGSHRSIEILEACLLQETLLSRRSSFISAYFA